MSKDLDLIVHASQVNYRLTAHRAADAVAGAVKDAVPAGRDDESASGSFLVEPIAKAELGTGHEQFSIGAGWHLVQILIDDQGIHAVKGLPNRDGALLTLRWGVQIIPAIGRAGNSQLSRAVDVLNNRVWGGFGPLDYCFHGQCLTTKEAQAKPGVHGGLKQTQALHEEGGRGNGEPGRQA